MRRELSLLSLALLVGAGFAWLKSANAAMVAPPVDPKAGAIAFDGRTMGTTYRVTIVATDSSRVAPAARAAGRGLSRVDSLMSNWTTRSEVARLNALPAGRASVVEPQTARVLATAFAVGAESEGAFDITVEPLVRAWGFLGGKPHVPRPGEADSAFAKVGWRNVAFDASSRKFTKQIAGARIDLGGIAKGHGVDAAAESLLARGIHHALVDVSGNMRALGRPAPSTGSDTWRIGVRDPRDRRPYFARLGLQDGEGVSTSAKYEQFVAADGVTYGHIIDPRTGFPAAGLIAVTVFAPNATLADAWSTALFVLGPDGAKQKARSLPDVHAILVAEGRNGPDVVWVESSLRDRFELSSEAAGDFTVEYFE